MVAEQGLQVLEEVHKVVLVVFLVEVTTPQPQEVVAVDQVDVMAPDLVVVVGQVVVVVHPVEILEEALQVLEEVVALEVAALEDLGYLVLEEHHFHLVIQEVVLVVVVVLAVLVHRALYMALVVALE